LAATNNRYSRCRVSIRRDNRNEGLHTDRESGPGDHPPADQRGSARSGLLSSNPSVSPCVLLLLFSCRAIPSQPSFLPRPAAGFRVSTRMGRDSIAKRYIRADRPSLSVSNHLLPDRFPPPHPTPHLAPFSFFPPPSFPSFLFSALSLSLSLSLSVECPRLIARVTFLPSDKRVAVGRRAVERRRYLPGYRASAVKGCAVLSWN